MKDLRLLPYLLILSMLAACIETDIAVPSFPDIVRHFGTTEALVQLTLSLNFLAFCLAALIYGPLSDTQGRRPVMVWGSLFFLVGGIGCATAQSIYSLLAWRFFQGFGSSAATIVCFAMIADVYKGEEASRFNSILNGVVTAAMAGAPMVGGFLNETWGWRSNYTFVALFCLVSLVLLAMFLPETQKERQPLNLRMVISNYGQLLRSRGFWALSLVPNLLSAGYMAFVGSAVFFYVGRLGLSVPAFTWHQTSVIVGFSVISLLSGKINKTIGATRAVLTGTVLTTVCGAGMLTLALVDCRIPVLYTVAMSGYSVGAAMCFGATFAASMALFPDLAGAASSVNMSARLFLISLAIWTVGVVANGTLLPAAMLIATAALCSAVLIAFIFGKPQLKELMT